MDETDIRQLLNAGRRREAFEMIVTRYQEKVFHLALSLTRNEATARDMAQDAFLRLWKALPGYDGRALVSTWLYTITRNVCFNELKRAARRQAASLDADDEGASARELAAPQPVEAGAEMDIDAMLAHLPEKYQRVLRLYYLEQRSYEETGGLLGIPVGTVKTFLFRARKELAKLAARAEQAAQPEAILQR
jgi:RNA polymerase sigma-70 factor, ECF subfamily